MPAPPWSMPFCVTPVFVFLWRMKNTQQNIGPNPRDALNVDYGVNPFVMFDAVWCL